MINKLDTPPPSNAVPLCTGMYAIEILLRAAVSPGYSIADMEGGKSGPLIPCQPCVTEVSYPTPVPELPEPEPEKEVSPPPEREPPPPRLNIPPSLDLLPKYALPPNRKIGFF